MHHLPHIWYTDGVLVDCGLCDDVLAGPQVEQGGHLIQGRESYSRKQSCLVLLQREKADSVLQTHRQRYGIEPGGGGLFRSEA